MATKTNVGNILSLVRKLSKTHFTSFVIRFELLFKCVIGCLILEIRQYLYEILLFVLKYVSRSIDVSEKSSFRMNLK